MLTIELDSAPSRTDIQTIRSGLGAYNLKHVPVLTELVNTDVAIVARGQDKQIIGGAIGELSWGWLYVDTLWVDASHRQNGLGRQLMAAIEDHALQNGIPHCYLMTTSFQARPFYEKLGYKVIGQNQDRPRGHTMYYLTKVLLPAQNVPEFEIQSPPYAHVAQRLNDIFIQDAEKNVPLINQPLAIFLRDEAGTVQGGLFGNLFWDWFDLRFVWIDDAYRGQGYARRLFEVLDAELQRRHTIGIVADTTDFQALDFYKTIGFEVFGTLADRPPGHTSYLIQKSLG
ncbi:MAG: GNAT family N-acetyltransferase [Anaerolineae bacterium]|nr:GNAT family N-acetyltransferase [Anaerolineae bacterium]MCA9888687.1 GNAT family N-acetyltransferase [Anaerolineae bacterium]